MKTIWKYLVDVGENEIDVPWGSKLLCMKEQHGDLFVWFLISDTDREKVKKKFFITETGFEIKRNPLNYINTVITKHGFVRHLFE